MENSHVSSSPDFCSLNKEKQVRFKMLIDYFDEKKTFNPNSLYNLQQQPSKSILKNKKKFKNELKEMLNKRKKLICLLNKLDKEQGESCEKLLNNKEILSENNKNALQNHTTIFDKSKVKLEEVNISELNDQMEPGSSKFNFFSTVEHKSLFGQKLNQDQALFTSLECPYNLEQSKLHNSSSTMNINTSEDEVSNNYDLNHKRKKTVKNSLLTDLPATSVNVSSVNDQSVICRDPRLRRTENNVNLSFIPVSSELLYEPASSTKNLLTKTSKIKNASSKSEIPQTTDSKLCAKNINSDLKLKSDKSSPDLKTKEMLLTARCKKLENDSHHWFCLYNDTLIKWKELYDRLIFLDQVKISACEADKKRLEIEEDFSRVEEINQRQNREIADLMHQVRMGNNFQTEVRQLRLNESKLKEEIEELKFQLKKKCFDENENEKNVLEILKLNNELKKARNEIETLKKEKLILNQENATLESEKAIFYEGFNAANITLEKEKLKVKELELYKSDCNLLQMKNGISQSVKCLEKLQKKIKFIREPNV